MASHHLNFTKAALAKAPAANKGSKDYYYDTKEKGLMMAVTPAGTKSFYLYTYASNAVSGGMPIHMVGKLLGHSQLQTTMCYAHLADDPVNRAAEENANRLSAVLSIDSKNSPRLRVVC